MLHVLRTKKGFKITFFVNMKGKIYTLNIGKLNVFKIINDVIRCFKLELYESDMISTYFFHGMIFKAIRDHIFISYDEKM